MKKKSIVEQLNAYLKDATPEQLSKDWAAVKKLGLKGPSVEEFLKANNGMGGKSPLVNASYMANTYPETFKVPSKAAIDAIEVGDYMKVCTEGGRGERFWVEVTELLGDGFYFGCINNALVLTHLHGWKEADEVVFHREHVYNVLKKDD
jgi:hypothetical protein